MFKLKIIETPIYDTFPCYSGNLGCVTACNFFAGEFAKRDERRNATLRTCVTSAVDPQMFAGTLENIKPFLVKDKSQLGAADIKRASTSPLLESLATSPEQKTRDKLEMTV